MLHVYRGIINVATQNIYKVHTVVVALFIMLDPEDCAWLCVAARAREEA